MDDYLFFDNKPIGSSIALFEGSIIDTEDGLIEERLLYLDKEITIVFAHGLLKKNIILLK